MSILMLCTSLSLGAAQADVSRGFVSLLKTSVEKGDEATFRTILATGLATWPDARIATLRAANTLKPEWLLPDQSAELIAAKEKAEAADKAQRDRGIVYYFDPRLWDGQAELGGGKSTGDTKEQAVTLGLRFGRKFGTEWEHDFDLRFDMARSNGETTRNRFNGKYEALWRPWPKAFVINYIEAELDQFSGYDYRLTENLGLGYHLIESERQSLRLEAGPGVRFSKFEETGLHETEYLGRVSGTYELKFSDAIAVKNRASILFGDQFTNFENLMQFTARINAHMMARLSLEVKYDSLAPAETAFWDTVTRATLVYDF